MKSKNLLVWLAVFVVCLLNITLAAEIEHLQDRLEQIESENPSLLDERV